MRTHSFPPLMLAAVLALGACAKKAETPPAPAPAPEASAAAAPEAAPTATPSPTTPANAKVFFVDLKDGAEVTSPVLIKFGAEGVELAPAGEDKPNAGHHHLIIDADLPPPDAPVPADANHLHFGKGQSEASVELAPGKHTLQLSFANYLHVPYAPALASDKITITVK